MEREETVLVIASDAALRRSLVFLLEAAGFRVTAHEALDHAPAMRQRRSACAVVDDELVNGAGDLWPAISALADTVILLQSEPHDLPEGVLAVEKPMLGEHLVDAVRAAVGRTRSATRTT